MICLWCRHVLAAESRECERCGTLFLEQPPIVGINHLTQLLQALQQAQSGELDREELAGVFGHFCERWQSFEERWSPPLRPRLAGHLEAYAACLSALDSALQQARTGFAEIEAYLSAESDCLDEACTHLRQFFGAACSAGAELLERLDTPSEPVLEGWTG